MAERRTSLRLHRSIYPAAAVKATAVAFADLTEATIVRDGDYHQVELQPTDDSLTPEQLRHEFANFALGRAARSR